MRSYGFDVQFAKPRGDGVIARVSLNDRFAASEMVEDFPRNTVQELLDIILNPPLQTSPVRWQAGPNNSVDVVALEEMRIAPWHLAVMLNLVDFGSDFEEEVSQTLNALTLFHPRAADLTVDAVLSALDAENEAAAGFMSTLMAAHPSDEEFATTSWPLGMHTRFLYDLRLPLSRELTEDEKKRLNRLVVAWHRVTAWTGSTSTMAPETALGEGYSTFEHEFKVDDRRYEHFLRTPACDPALGFRHVLQWLKHELGVEPVEPDIYVSAAD